MRSARDHRAPAVSAPPYAMRTASTVYSRACRFERMEARLMLSANSAEGSPQEEPVLWLPGSISGAVYASLQPDAERRPDDQGIPNVQLDLLDDQGRVVAQTTTDGAGQYEFSPLAPGRYAVREHQPAGMPNGQAWIGDGGGQLTAIDVIGDVWVGAGENLAGYDFAETAAAWQPPLGLSEFFGGPSLPFMAAGELPAIERHFSFSITEQVATSETPVSFPAAEPLAAPTATPVFGGSSRELERDRSTSEIKRSVADPDESWLAENDEHAQEAPIRVTRLPANEAPAGGEAAARDQAFELDGQQEEIQPPTPNESQVKLLTYGQ
jgi:hypothetical protein